MKVFVSAKYPLNECHCDHPATAGGELVVLWKCGRCGDCCDIGFIGLESLGIAAYARVVERADIDEASLVTMLKADSAIRDALASGLQKHMDDYLDHVARETIEMAAHYEVGDLVTRCIGGVVGCTVTSRRTGKRIG